MQRQPSKEELAKYYQIGVAENQMKKASDKNIRIEEEKRMLDRLNREIEEENKHKMNAKIQRNNEMMEDYNQSQHRKQIDKEGIKGKRNNSQFDDANFKIGGENREIKRKNYEDVTNNLVLNPGRKNEVRNARVELQDMGAIRQQNRGRSQGYNIINHSNPDPNANNNYNIARINNDNQKQSESDRGIPQNNQHMEVLDNYNPNNVNPYANVNNNYNYKSNNVQQQNSKPEFDEAEYEKYYQEYIRQKEAAEGKDEKQINSFNDYEKFQQQNQQQNYNYENSAQNQEIQPIHINEIENQMKNLNVNNNRNVVNQEYLYNKMKNAGAYNMDVNKENV